ncbi:MAG TPA: protein kinase [Vicinamibacterales bacterium]|jgi:serine/threonine protein kinase|nr:protein kinase [Vicinamibacterales bacterium]
MLGRTISHYRITSQLGAGGMAVVYAGEDIRLGRPVALKFVPEELGDPVALERLRAEARAASALNHPNICTIYDIGDHDGRPYIVMELLKGHTLRDVLAAGPLKIHQIVDIGIQVADALDAAHSHGILHRDIKPANLFLVDRGAVKILDFGLAKQLQPRSPSGTVEATMAPELLTAEGVTVGTVSYMSPEQVTGEQLDGRTDLFSLGIVLYECVTGRRPFTGKTSAVILAAILNESPVAPVIFNPHIPARLQDVINNCLEKDPELRYQDAAGLRADLKRIRRDLESGHSAAMKAASVATRAESRISGRGSRSTPVASEDAPVSHRRGAVTWGAALTASGVAALTSYWFWLKPPTPQSTPAPESEVSSSDTAGQNRIGLATSSLQAGAYRDALTYAEDVLRLFPNNTEAQRVRAEARAALDRFDEAIARGKKLLASGDADGASAALTTARTIDPSSSAVAALSEAIVAQYKNQASLARQRTEPPVAPPSLTSRQPSNQTPPPDRVSPPPAPQETRPVAAAPSPVLPPPAAEPSQPGPRPSPTPPVAETLPAAPPPAEPQAPPEPVAPRTEAPAPNRSAEAAASPPVEDDDAQIRRSVEAWARAIEEKDLAAYRALKPNMTPAEQRRIEEGFRAVSSQRVAVTILGIERQAQRAVVRLRRRDTIVAGGRQQTQDTQQTMTFIRSGSGWVISDIGR